MPSGLACGAELRLLSQHDQLQGTPASMARWIASDADLASALDGLDAELIALDTEFVREKTYYAQLALVQLAARDDILLIDPLALDQAAALRRALTGPGLKLMHSPSEDLQALKHRYGVLPRPLFDTQVAAALVGLGAGLGYQALIERLLESTWKRAKPVRIGCAGRCRNRSAAMPPTTCSTSRRRTHSWPPACALAGANPGWRKSANASSPPRRRTESIPCRTYRHAARNA